MSALDECTDPDEYIALLESIARHDARQGAYDEARAAHLAAVGAVWESDPLLLVECTSCGQTLRACLLLSYAGVYSLTRTTPVHAALRELLDAQGLDMSLCCLACSHQDRHGHRSHARAVAQVRAERRTAGSDALAHILARQSDPWLAPASTTN